MKTCMAGAKLPMDKVDVILQLGKAKRQCLVAQKEIMSIPSMQRLSDLLEFLGNAITRMTILSGQLAMEACNEGLLVSREFTPEERSIMFFQIGVRVPG